MAFSYNAENLTAPLNHLRLLVQDTIAEGRFFEDSEIEFIHSQSANVYRAAASLCRTVAARLAKMPSQKESTIQFDAEARIREMRILAENYDREAQRIEQSVNSPGESGLGTISLTADSGESAFSRGLHYSD